MTQPDYCSREQLKKMKLFLIPSSLNPISSPLAEIHLGNNTYQRCWSLTWGFCLQSYCHKCSFYQVLNWHCVAQSPIVLEHFISMEKVFQKCLKTLSWLTLSMQQQNFHHNDLHSLFSILHLCRSSLQSKSMGGFFTSQLGFPPINNVPSDSQYLILFTTNTFHVISTQTSRCKYTTLQDFIQVMQSSTGK